MTLASLIVAYVCDTFDWLDDDEITYLIQAGFIIDLILGAYLNTEH